MSVDYWDGVKHWLKDNELCTMSPLNSGCTWILLYLSPLVCILRQIVYILRVNCRNSPFIGLRTNTSYIYRSCYVATLSDALYFVVTFCFLGKWNFCEAKPNKCSSSRVSNFKNLGQTSFACKYFCEGEDPIFRDAINLALCIDFNFHGATLVSDVPTFQRFCVTPCKNCA